MEIQKDIEKQWWYGLCNGHFRTKGKLADYFSYSGVQGPHLYMHWLWYCYLLVPSCSTRMFCNYKQNYGSKCRCSKICDRVKIIARYLKIENILISNYKMNTYIDKNLKSTDKKLQNQIHSQSQTLITLYLYHVISPPKLM